MQFKATLSLASGLDDHVVPWYITKGELRRYRQFCSEHRQKCKDHCLLTCVQQSEWMNIIGPIEMVYFDTITSVNIQMIRHVFHLPCKRVNFGVAMSPRKPSERDILETPSTKMVLEFGEYNKTIEDISSILSERNYT
ncbi:unnamed protein product [Heterotrigona itama]|uniref:Uncharacterized protein n=1 Tax=Heterotrigona itama TaxID=395501 RepID=A0A6V7GUA4_9HYME|nr:unnamed protein product [Heterotrigona itama]